MRQRRRFPNEAKSRTYDASVEPPLGVGGRCVAFDLPSLSRSLLADVRVAQRRHAYAMRRTRRRIEGIELCRAFAI